MARHAALRCLVSPPRRATVSAGVWACAGWGGAWVVCGRVILVRGTGGWLWWRAGGGAPGVLGAVLRRGRVYAAVGVAGPRGGPGTADVARTAVEEACDIARRLRCQPLLDRAESIQPPEPRIRVPMVTTNGPEESATARDG